MADIELDLLGFQEMIDTLDSMGEEGEKIFKNSLNEGAKPVKAAMERRAPVRTGLLKVNIKIGSVRKLKNGIYTQVIGPGKGDISKVFYGKFTEYGTSKQPAKPWMRPAFDESQDEAYRIIEQIIQDGIEQSFNKK